MRLLAKNEISTLRQKQTDEEVRLVNALSTEVTDLQKKLNLLQNLYQKEKEEKLIEHQLWKEKLETTKKELLDEVIALEQRRRIALTPLDSEKMRLKELEKNLQKQQEILSYRSLELDKLESKLSDLRSELNNKKNTIETEKNNLKYLKEQLDKEISKIALDRQELALDQEKQEKKNTKEMAKIREEYDKLVIIKSEIKSERVIIEERIKELETLREEVNKKLARVHYVKD